MAMNKIAPRTLAYISSVNEPALGHCHSLFPWKKPFAVEMALRRGISSCSELWAVEALGCGSDSWDFEN